MVKKNKNRQMQESPATQNGGDSAESCDQKKTSESRCPHIQKAVHLASIKKALKSGCLAAECPVCAKEGLKYEPGEGGEGGGLWLCLQCGHQGCGRNQNQHALKHFNVVHSDPHCLAVNTTTWNVWCYRCNVELDSEYRKKLLECVKFLKNLDYPTSIGGSAKSYNGNGNKETDSVDSSSMPLSDVTNVPHGVRNAPKKKVMVNLPRVRGLYNRGNTCFFNAVMQCLAQTPHFLELLQDMRQGGEKFCLPGGKGLLRKPDSKPEDEEYDEELTPLEGTLARSGLLTETLTSTLEELREDDATAVNPQRLFTKLTTKWPQFGGGEQHDAHELLRHLLDEVRTEDLKRYWSAILNEYGLTKHDNDGSVDVLLKARIKAYGKQAGERLLLPDPVFRGILVSTVECQDCLHSYQRTEPFYELSLPVSTNKVSNVAEEIVTDRPQPPVMRRKSGAEDTFDVCGNPTSDTPSKHQLKKERRQMRLERKKGRGRNQQIKSSPSSETMSKSTIAEEPSCNTAESEQSDADVEDNVELDVSSKKLNHSPENPERTGSLSTDDNQSKTTSSSRSQNENDDESKIKRSAVEENGVYEMDNSKVENDDELKSSGISFQLMKDSLIKTKPSEELSLVISAGPNSPSALGSPLSNTGSPSSVSSDMNVDLSVSNHLPAGSWPNEETDRPYSRIEFCNDDESGPNSEHVVCNVNGVSADKVEGSRNCSNETLSADNLSKELGCLSLSHEDRDVSLSNDLAADSWPNEETDRPFSRIAFCEDESVPKCEQNNTATIADVADDISVTHPLPYDKETPSADHMDSLFLSHEANRQSPSHWDTCSAHSAEDSKEAKSLLPLEIPICNGVGRSSDPEPMDDGDKSGTLAPRYHCGDKECSIESCLNQFTLLELMTGSCKVICENCSERINKGKPGKQIATNSTKQYLVSNPPAVLVLHLKRFELHQNIFRKTPRHVTFPMLLDIAPICNTKCRELPTMRKGQTKVLYSLYGVIQHSGTLHGGHYSAYVKVRPPVKKDDLRWCFLPTSQSSHKLEELSKETSIPTEPLPGKWYHVSDSKVNEVNEDRVLHSQAYLLFYERVW